MIAVLADWLVKATVILLLAAAVTVALHRSAASFRHLVWTLACGGVLALPIASAVLPNWRVAGWPSLGVPVAFEVQAIPTERAQPAAPAATVVATHDARRPTDDQARPANDENAPVRWQLRSNWTALIVPVWLSGVASVLILLAVALARIVWLERITIPVRDARWLLLVEELSLELGLTRSVRLLKANGPAMPMTWGIRRPAILLPAEADSWTDERRRDVLLHELAHVKRHDFLVQLIGRVACAVYWFHPLVWLAATRLRIERERACDDQVLRAGATPSAYASHLLEIARDLRAARATALASVAMARPAQLAGRLLDVLDPRRRRDTLSPRAALPAWIGAALVVVPLAIVAPRVAQPAAVALGSIDTIPRVPSPMLGGKRNARSAHALAVVDTLRGCSGTSAHSHSSTQEENDDITIDLTAGRCVVRLASVGKFTFNDDFTDIAAVAADGQVVVEVDYGAGGSDRRLMIRRGSGGALERTYKVDGETKAFDADARAWFSETLTYILRRTGFMAKERAQWILNHKGLQGLFDELNQISGDYARRVYFQAAIDSGKLDAAGYERIVALAVQTIDSDYELAELLIAVSGKQPLTEQMQASFVQAAKKIDSDYERHRVLKVALARPGLTPAMESAMLDAAGEMNSDYELAELLIELNTARPIDEAMRPAYFRAANKIGSDYEHRRVLAAVVKREGMTPAMLSDVLGSAKGIHSDYELAELLTEIGGSYTLNDTLRPAFFAAANNLNSDYEHGRTLLSVVQRGAMSRPVALAVIESAKNIHSDHELADVLVAVIHKVQLDDAIRAAVRADAQGIDSQYERGRVYEALGVKEM